METWYIEVQRFQNRSFCPASCMSENTGIAKEFTCITMACRASCPIIIIIRRSSLNSRWALRRNGPWLLKLMFQKSLFKYFGSHNFSRLVFRAYLSFKSSTILVRAQIMISLSGSDAILLLDDKHQIEKFSRFFVNDTKQSSKTNDFRLNSHSIRCASISL